MVVCKQYQQGFCDTVFTCPNEHINIRHIIQRDIDEAVNGKIWPLSTYGPFINKPSLPNFIEDQSFEEVRMMFYETKLKNSFVQYHEQYNKDVQEARNKMKVTQDLVNMAIILYDTYMGGQKNSSSETNSSGATFQIISPFRVEQSSLTTSNKNFILGLPKLASNSYHSPIMKATNVHSDNSLVHYPFTTSKPNSNPFGRTNTASTTAPPLSIEYPFNYNINNSSGITNSASARTKHDTNNLFGIPNSAGFTFKTFPSENFNNNILEKEAIGDRASFNNLFRMENVAGATSNSNLSTINNTNSFEIGGNTSKLVPAFGTNNNPSGMVNTASGDCKFGVDNSKNLFGGGFRNTSWYNCPPNMYKGCIFQNAPIEFWPDDHYIVKRIDKSIMDLMLVDMLPYSVVDGTAFKRLQFADPFVRSRYKMKSEQFFTETLMPETFNKVKEKMMTMMATTKWISLTIDKWKSSPVDSNLLVTFTAHFLHGALKKKLVLAANVLENDQLDSYISEKLPEILNNFKLEEKLHLTTCDNVVNLENVNITVFECVAHTMKLVVHDAIFHKQHVQEILVKCRKIAKHFEISKQAREYFETMQGKYLLEKQCLLQDADKNWTSTYLMIKRFVEQKITVSLYSDEKKGDIENVSTEEWDLLKDIEYLTTEEWDLLKDIVLALEGIYEATAELTADTATVSLIIPLIKLLDSKLNDEANEASQVQNDLKLALNERFKFIETSPPLIISTLLDPRFKNIYLSPTQMAIAEKEITNFLQIDSKNSLQTCNKEDQQRKTNNTLWQKHDITIETDASFRNELSLYIHEPLTLRKTNIYEYWKTSRYEKLKKVAEKYIFIPPTIVANEQMLKTAGSLYADRKAYLKGVNVEELLFCHFNIQLLEFDY